MLILAALLVLPWVLADTYFRHTLILVFIYAVLASNWDVSLGLGGVVNFAHMAFFAIGLYAYGIMTATEHGSSRNRIAALTETKMGTDKWLILLSPNRRPHSPENGSSG